MAALRNICGLSCFLSFLPLIISPGFDHRASQKKGKGDLHGAAFRLIVDVYGSLLIASVTRDSIAGLLFLLYLMASILRSWGNSPLTSVSG